ncbi:MAG TPA: thioredoxin domain-containing protein [Xanthomonadales bacterium]|nr:thioredoxin domain-containing protein [Xanthomonadales bacterium]
MNRLQREASLYLRQHADNPVHWQPWDEQALQTARDSQRPILLSIGYSACHWCHVMAHESFEDEATAEVMNRLFVNIKVDREERPDLDRIYQLSHQLLTGRGGGWPLTVFLDPQDLVPFFAGTYFPRERRYGMPAFRELLAAIDEWFRNNDAERQEQSLKLRAALESIQGRGASGGVLADQETAENISRRAAEQLHSRFDPANGGFGGAPRFPQAPLLEAVAALADHPAAAGQGLEEALQLTLSRMAQSGLRDHLDGGFFRYCVDATWTIPHFEKMLYDNAMLLPLYAEGARRWGDATLRSSAEGIADWLDAAMRRPTGGYAASIDADAGGEEGGFHVWSPEEVESILEDPDLGLFRRAYGLDQPPNFENRAWHLQPAVPAAVLGEEFGLSEAAVETSLGRSRALLRERRESRQHPTLDDKRLTAWNALLAGGFVRAARALGRDDWLDRAEDIFSFLRRELWRDGVLYAVFNSGESRLRAYLDDHAWLLNALLDFLAARWNPQWLEFAVELADTLLERFEDPEAGGFYFSDEAVDVPVTRSMIFADDATPSGNGSAIIALNRLARLLGEPRYGAAAERALARAGQQLEESPLACATLLLALMDTVRPPAKLIIAGTDRAARDAMQAWAEGRYQVDCYVVGPAVDGLPGILSQFRSDRPVAAWLCRGTQCLPPVENQGDLDRLMDETSD